MPQIIGVKFKNSTKAYYFSPEGIDFKMEDGTIVETARGVEYGTVVIPNREVKDSEIVQPLKPVLRKATVDDQEQYDRNHLDAERALKTAVEKLPKHNLDLKFVDVEYTFDRKKIIFYFTAPGRVDFRDFVRDLGATFKTRIELRQIHERDDFKMKGALASCGRPCCCCSHLNDFEKVSIKMAKVQGLSLNPQKISGMCGKLMCCLKYEQDTYREAATHMPKEGATVMTPDGEGRVESNDLLRMRSRVRINREDGVLRNYYEVKDMRFECASGSGDYRNSSDDADEIIDEDILVSGDMEFTDEGVKTVKAPNSGNNQTNHQENNRQGGDRNKKHYDNRNNDRNRNRNYYQQKDKKEEQKG